MSAAWRFSEEDFFERLRPVVNDAKVRLSWGKIGNNSGVDRYYQKDTYNSYPYTFGDNVIAEGYAPYKLIDPNFTWESTAMTNVGLELSFLNSRLRTEIDFYSKLTTNMIRPGQRLRIPGTGDAEAADTVIHTVSAGETLSSIANRYGVTVTRLKRSNRLTSNTLHIGDKLEIPAREQPRASSSGVRAPQSKQSNIPKNLLNCLLYKSPKTFCNYNK